MPQLITLLYHHDYLSLIIILALSFLLFFKYFLSLLVKLVKLSARSSYEVLYNSLIYFISRDFVKARNDLYLMSCIELCISIYTSVFQIYNCIYNGFIVKNNQLNYSLNSIFLYFFRNVSIYLRKFSLFTSTVIEYGIYSSYMSLYPLIGLSKSNLYLFPFYFNEWTFCNLRLLDKKTVEY